MNSAYVNLIRWAFTRFYREFAWSYDTVAALVSGGQWRSWTLAALPYLQGRVLELGCGTGNLQLALAKTQTHKAVGLDASPQMLALTRAKLSRSGHLAPVLRGDARALPFPHASFDTLVATFPSEYIAEPTTLLEARRVLRPGGRIVIILAAHFVRSNLYRQVVNLLYRITLQRPVLTPVTPDPRTFLGERVAEAGFMVREQWVPAAEKNVQLHFIVGELPGDANS